MGLLAKIRRGRASTNPKAVETNAWIRHLMIGIAADPFALTEIVAAGPADFVNRFLTEGKGLAVDRDIALKVYAFFCQKVVDKWGGLRGEQYLAADVQSLGPLIAKEFLDKVEVVSPPTQREVDESWEHECDSSEEAKRTFYRDGKNPDLPSKPIIIH